MVTTRDGALELTPPGSRANRIIIATCWIHCYLRMFATDPSLAHWMIPLTHYLTTQTEKADLE